MKSILADFRRSKTATLAILEALNFNFLGISHLKMSKNSINLITRAANRVKMTVIDLLKSAKIDFT